MRSPDVDLSQLALIGKEEADVPSSQTKFIAGLGAVVSILISGEQPEVFSLPALSIAVTVKAYATPSTPTKLSVVSPTASPGLLLTGTVHPLSEK